MGLKQHKILSSLLPLFVDRIGKVGQYKKQNSPDDTAYGIHLQIQ